MAGGCGCIRAIAVGEGTENRAALRVRREGALAQALRRLQRRTPPAKPVHQAIARALRVKIATQMLPTVQPKMINVWRSFSMAFNPDESGAGSDTG
jgi:hypothetical protein